MEIREKLWLLGPGRRTDQTVFEQQLILEDAEKAALAGLHGGLLTVLSARLAELGIGASESLQSFRWDAHDEERSLFEVFARLAIIIQREAGHRVTVSGTEPDSAGGGIWTWFEYEHDAVGAAAAFLAWKTLTELLPALHLPELATQADELQDKTYKGFLALARPLALPLDTDAIIHAALARDIPCVKLDRAPYEGVKGNFRIRNNGLLKLGHNRHHLVVDGTICVHRSSHLLPLLKDKMARSERLKNSGCPVPRTDPQAGNCALTKHALRSAEKIGYPVTLIVTASNGQQFTWPDIDSAEYLRTTLDAARRYGSSIELEGRVSGESWQLLLVGKSPLALFQAGVFHDPASIHPETLRMAVALSGQLDSGLMIIKLRTPDITFPLAESGGAFLDFELAPNLEELLGAHPALLQIAATAFVDWLFPPARSARIPIVAVTGTNGKTTTCRMIEFIARKSGMGTGMACTGANYILGQLPDEESRVGTGRQFRLFDIPEVEIAIVEEFLGTIIGTGFAYHYSDVAVCTNVTQDHFGRVGIHDMDTLAAAKFLAVQRARHAAVLNADNSYSFDMMGRSSAKKIGLVSMRQNAEDLLKALDRPGVVCTLENSPDGRWLVFNDGEQRRPLMRESEIPAGFDGKAAHNVCNAMQAALACWFVGMNLEQIRSGLADFRTDFDTAPGRLNFMQGLPFQFILDYAHNLDGYRVLCEFVDKIQISGRKILCVAAAGDRQDKEIREAITFLVNHFDFFVCRSYPQLRGRQPGEIPRLIKRCLTDAGVPESAIQLEFDANDAVRSALETASPGDLLIVLSGGNEFKQIWTLAEALKVHSPGHPDQIEAFNPSGH